MKKTLQHFIKTYGINAAIAVNAGIIRETGGMSNIYKRIKCKLWAQQSKDEIAHDLMIGLQMVKDFAQYQ